MTPAPRPRGRIVLAGELALLPADARRAAIAVAMSIASVTAAIVLLDAVLFRRHLDPGYVAFFTSPLLPRMPVICVFAAWEEVKFRLLAMTALVALARLARRDLPPTAYVAIILVAQFANVGTLVIADPLYASLRYWAVGAVWGWLYWRHGWLAALAGHGFSHLLLDPVLRASLLATA